MRTSRALVRGGTAAFLAAVVTLAGAEPARALGPRDRHLTSTRQGISVEAPAGWTLSQHTGYGDTVVILLHPDGSRISLTAAPTTATDTAALLEQNRKGLVAQKLNPSGPQPGPRGFLAIDIASPGRPDRLRQLYLVRPTPTGRQAVILTLVGRAAAFDDQLAALEFVVNRMAFDDPTPPPDAAAKNPTPLVPRLALSGLGDPSGAAGGASGAPRAGAGGSRGQLGPDAGKRSPRSH
jgi:hypothetical protein